jgi:hypothetical protein
MTIKQNYYVLAFALVLGGFFIQIAPAHAATAKSKAEGADRTAAARASEWTGTIIGVNFGEHSVVITEGTALDHIKKFAQRSVKVTSDSQVFKNGEFAAFEDLDVGQRITVSGSYNATSRIVTADRVDIGVRVAAVPAAKPKAAAVSDTPVAAKKVLIARNLQVGSSGADVIALQKILIAKKFLVMPSGAKLGTFGVQTKTALQKYQKAMGISATGSVGPQTRTKLNKG